MTTHIRPVLAAAVAAIAAAGAIPALTAAHASTGRTQIIAIFDKPVVTTLPTAP